MKEKIVENSVTIIIGSLELGGAEYHLSQVLPSLVEKGWAVRILTLTGRGSLADSLEKKGVPVMGPPDFLKKMPRLFKLLIANVRLVRYFLKNPKGIVHFYLPEAYLLGTLASVLALFRGTRVMSRRSLNVYQTRRPFLGKLEHLIHRFTDFFLCNSRRVQDELKKEISQKKSFALLYNGIDIQSLKPKRSPEEMKRFLQIPEESLVITSVANLIPYKGHLDILEALAGIEKPWVFIAVGGDPAGHLKVLEEKARSLGIQERCRFVGQSQEVGDFLSISDIGVLASHEEGFSNALLQKMAMGLPVVATDVGGNREALEESGILVPSHDPAALRTAFIALFSSKEKREALGKAARQRVERYFSLSTCVNRYDAFYRALSCHELPKQDCLGQIEE